MTHPHMAHLYIFRAVGWIFGLDTAAVGSMYRPDMYGIIGPDFHRFDRFELDLRGHTHVRGAAFSCLRLKLADIVLI